MANGYEMVDGKKCVWVKEVGFCPAKQGADLKVGDVLIGDYDIRSTITKIERETKTNIFVTVLADGGIEYSNVKIGKETYKACKGAK